MEYKDKLLDCKFDEVLNFLGEIGRHELFRNAKYNDIKEGKLQQDQVVPEHKFIENFSERYDNLHLSNQLLEFLNVDYEVFEVYLPKLNKAGSPTKK
jgi:hypothetical protein